MNIKTHTYQEDEVVAAVFGLRDLAGKKIGRAPTEGKVLAYTEDGWSETDAANIAAHEDADGAAGFCLRAETLAALGRVEAENATALSESARREKKQAEALRQAFPDAEWRDGVAYVRFVCRTCGKESEAGRDPAREYGTPQAPGWCVACADEYHNKPSFLNDGAGYGRNIEGED